MRSQVWLSLVVCLGAAAQERPQKLCSFDGFSADPKLAEVTKATVGYFGCAAGKDCMPTKLAAGDAVTPYHTDGDWTCAYLQQYDGAGPGWVKSQDIRGVPADAAPPLDAWSGTWANGPGRIVIGSSKSSGKLQLEGEAEWHGRGDVVHTGNFAGDAVPTGNHLHFVEAGADSCTVDLTLVGKYLVVNDNDRCGGMNVRFWGVWKRIVK
jgi:hypothetical protein